MKGQKLNENLAAGYQFLLVCLPIALMIGFFCNFRTVSKCHARIGVIFYDIV
jgi:hypothetical protein